MELNNEKAIVSKEAKIQQENAIRRKNYVNSNPEVSFQEKLLVEGADVQGNHIHQPK